MGPLPDIAAAVAVLKRHSALDSRRRHGFVECLGSLYDRWQLIAPAEVPRQECGTPDRPLAATTCELEQGITQREARV